MPISSTQRSDYSLDLGDSKSIDIAVPKTDTPNTPKASVKLDLPGFGPVSDNLYAKTARLAGRVNAASVSTEEQQALLRERQSLLEKKFADIITRKESNRLEYIRWSLDRIEDAKHGEALDNLENYVDKYETMLSDLRGFEATLQYHLKQKK